MLGCLSVQAGCNLAVVIKAALKLEIELEGMCECDKKNKIKQGMMEEGF